MNSMNQAAYVFDLKLMCGGYGYYSTFTLFKGFGNKYREIRKPSTVDVTHFRKSLKLMGLSSVVINDNRSYKTWIYLKGWAVVPETTALSLMPQWLKAKECTKSPLGVFTDIELVSPSTLKQYARKGKREIVFGRDAYKCLICGARKEDGVQLTMQHVISFSSGGETTTRNLVTLCTDCQKKVGRERLYRLYEIAGLHYGYDPSLIKNARTNGVLSKAFDLSDNLMQARCEVW